MQPLLPSFQKLSLTTNTNPSKNEPIHRNTHPLDLEWTAFYKRVFDADFTVLAEAVSLKYVSVTQLQSRMLMYQMQHPHDPIQFHLWVMKYNPSQLMSFSETDLLYSDVNVRINWIDVNIEAETADPPSLPPGWLWYQSRNGAFVYLGPRYWDFNSTTIHMANSLAMAWAVFLCVAVYDPTVFRDHSWMGVKSLVRSANVQNNTLYLEAYKDVARAIRIQNDVTQKVSKAVFEQFKTGGGSSTSTGDVKTDLIQNAASIVVSDLMKQSRKRVSGARNPNQPAEQAKQARREEKALEREQKNEQKRVDMERRLEEKRLRENERERTKLVKEQSKEARLLERQAKQDKQIQQDVFKVLEKMLTKIEREFAKTQTSEQKRAQQLIRLSAQSIDKQSDETQSALERTTHSMMNSVIKRVLTKARNRHSTYLKKQAYFDEKNDVERLLDRLEEEGNEAMVTNADITHVQSVMDSIRARLMASKETASTDELKERIDNEIVATVDAFETFLRRRRKDECIKAQRIAYEQRATQPTISGTVFIKAIEHLLDPESHESDGFVAHIQSTIPTVALSMFVTLIKTMFVGVDPDKLHSWNSIKTFTTEHICQHTTDCSVLLTYMDELFHSSGAIAHMCDEYESDDDEFDDDESGDELRSNVDEEDANEDSDDDLSDLEAFFDDSELDANETALAAMNMEKISIMMQNGRLHAGSSETAAKLQLEYVKSAISPDQFEQTNYDSIEKAFALQQTRQNASKPQQSGTKRRITPQLIQPLQLPSKQARLDALWQQTQTHFTHSHLSADVRHVLEFV